MSALSQAQQKFSWDTGRLLVFANEAGLRFTFGDAFAKEGHVRRSLHYERLAIDLNLFILGQYVTGDAPEWHDLARFWKSLDPLNRWGGDIAGALDYNHFSRVPVEGDPRI